MLLRTNEVLGKREAEIQMAVKDLVGAVRIATQQKLLDLQNLLDNGNRMARQAEAEDPDLSLMDRVRKHEQAIYYYERAREVMKWLPPNLAGIEDQNKRATQMIGECRKRIKTHELALKRENDREIQRRAEERLAEQQELTRRRLGMLMDQARHYLEVGEYDRAINLAKKIQDEDPRNSEAIAIEITACDRRHVRHIGWVREEKEEHMKKIHEQADEKSVPYQDYLIYPPPAQWRQICGRKGEFARARVAEPWKDEVRRKMARRVTFDYIDAPLSEVLNYLNSLTKLTLVLDPAIQAEAGAVKITLSIKDMDLETALRWVLRLANLTYDLRNQAVFITKPDRLVADVEMEIYDIRDLTTRVEDFWNYTDGPTRMLMHGQWSYAGGAGGAAPPPPPGAPGAQPMGAADLVALLRERLLPADFTDPKTTIEDVGGKLVVTQRPEVHQKIQQILRSFRETQTIQVLSQVRFIDVREGFLEQIGIHWLGLDSPIGQAQLPRALGYWPVPALVQGLAPAGGSPGSTLIPYVLQTGSGNVPEIFRAMGALAPGQSLISQYTTGLLHPRFDGNLGSYNVGDQSTTPFTWSYGPVGVRYQMGGGGTAETFPGSEADHLYQGMTANPVASLGSYGPLSGQLTSSPLGNQGALIQMRFIGQLQANAVLQALRKDLTSDVLFAPRLMQFNNQRSYAYMAISEQARGGVVTSGTIDVTQTATQSEGIGLELKPTVSHDRKYITLELRSVLSVIVDRTNTYSFQGTTGTFTGTATAGAPITGNVTGLATQQTVDLPTMELRGMETTVTVPDRGTLLFSGLINDKRLDAKTGVPFFSDLPVIGRLFCANSKHRERRNLLVMSRIVLFDEEEAAL
jgi:tetratricopeptide (TPR) repeat protein